VSIKQFNGEWVAREDRVLFRFNTFEDQEFSFWLTRFVVKSLIQGAQQLAVRTLETYQAPSQKPLGHDPLLVTGLVMNQNGEQTSVEFQLITGKSVNVQMNQAVMQVMVTLLNKLQDAAQWGVGFEPAPAALDAPKPSQPLMH
jgi:hypothetical protein